MHGDGKILPWIQVGPNLLPLLFFSPLQVVYYFVY